jgi:hypothetical protein
MPGLYGARGMGLFRRSVPVDPTAVDQMRAELAAMREAIDRHGSSAEALRGELAALDVRVTAVSTELANQLDELGHDLDALADRPDGMELAAVQAGQVRLANEQARYQIAFREDLARLAEQLTRSR